MLGTTDRCGESRSGHDANAGNLLEPLGVFVLPGEQGALLVEGRDAGVEFPDLVDGGQQRSILPGDIAESIIGRV